MDHSAVAPHRFVLAVLGIALAGCVGLIGDPGDPSPPSPPSPSSSATCDGGPSDPGVRTGPAPLRRLTRAEYNNTVRDLLGDASRPADAFVPETRVGGFDNNAYALTVTPVQLERYLAAAEALAERAAGDLPGLLAGCDPASAGEAVCAERFVRAFGRRAFRRPLADDEVAGMLATFAAGRAASDFRGGIQWTLERMLMAPAFLYRAEFGDATAARDGVVPLSSWEMASRLSYLLWGTMPDADLFAAADRDELRTPAQVAFHARRLLADPRARGAVANFHAQWLALDALDAAQKDTRLFPMWTDALRAQMRASLERFVDDVVWQGPGDLGALLTAPHAFVDAALAPLYGVAPPAGAPADALARVELDPAERAGVLTQLGLLAALAKPDQTSPVRRGVFVRTRLLCDELPPPPPGVNTTLSSPSPTATTRERLAQHTNSTACSGCHGLIDPIGFGFERYDAVGRYRTTEGALPIDASGSAPGTDVGGAFNGAVELAQRLARSDQVRRCVVRQWFRFAHGRLEVASDAATLDGLAAGFAGANGRIQDLVLALTQTDAFRYRPVVDPSR